ncbi:nitroreductase family protein [Evansella cellulosilytica]|uniref:Nitroreductase n=1 Tax=Evansella cellulosilytica (strain ATCC 21833 / DSM 2522 / FERM P-1141 / JCM 9156 / N-4) TaxID=649639 RepID=E6TUS6_EVAC2|nr:nitroreductase family protein [Evansella cellulosilytica]ADU32078.1 nitroreductase [Evansella cellulosilytica DSM 2522]
MSNGDGFIDLNFNRKLPLDQVAHVSDYANKIIKRKKVLAFSDREVEQEVIETAVKAAGTSPSGANQQPWKFITVKDPLVKKKVRVAAEADAKMNGAASTKAYLEEAPYLVVLFRENYSVKAKRNGEWKKVRHYYPFESTAICAGFFLAALENSGLDSIIHSPFDELSSILNRPKNETPTAVFAVGFAEKTNGTFNHSSGSATKLVIGDIDMGKKIADVSTSLPDIDPLTLAKNYYAEIKRRRNIRDFSTEDVEEELIIRSLKAAISSPSAGNTQPYRFAVVKNIEVKKVIREQAENEEKKLYEERISTEWKEALAPLATNWMKPHLTDAPYLIIAFKVIDKEQSGHSDVEVLGSYDKQHALLATGMSVGVLIGALHFAGLATLTYTPSPMAFLRDLLNRPKNEMPESFYQ